MISRLTSLRRRRPDPNQSSWIAVVLLALIVVLAESTGAKPYSTVESTYRLRLAHAGLAALVFLVALATRRSWNRSHGGWALLILIAPMYFISWRFHVTAVRSEMPWIPFAGYKLVFLVLSVLIAGPYWLNALLIAGFALEAFVLWYVLNLGMASNAVMPGEPLTITIFAVVSILLLAFRAYHDRVVRELAVAEIRAETLEQMARIFLTLRDRANTPVQTIESAAELLRRKHPEAARFSEVILRASSRLSDTSNLLTRLESQIAWTGHELMTDKEIRQWLDRLEDVERHPH